MSEEQQVSGFSISNVEEKQEFEFAPDGYVNEEELFKGDEYDDLRAMGAYIRTHEEQLIINDALRTDLPRWIDDMIILCLFHMPDYFTRVIDELQNYHFTDDWYQILFTDIRKHWQKYGEIPSAGQMLIIQNQHGYKDEKMKLIEQKFSVFSKGENLPGMQSLLDATSIFISNGETRHWMSELALAKSGMKAGNGKKYTFMECVKRLENAESFTFDKSIGDSYVESTKSRWDYYNSSEYHYPCGINLLDERLKGGVEKKTLSSILAATNVGKTMFMVSLACGYIRQGYNVLYVSLEEHEHKVLARVDANMLQIPNSQISTMTEEQYLQRVAEASVGCGDLTVKQYSPNSISVNHIRALIKDYKKQKDKNIDILIVDYIGLLGSAIYRKGDVKTYEYLKSVSEELRGLCIEEDVAGWTALQTNRDGVGAENVGLDKVAASYDVTQGLDYVISIWQNDADKNVLHAKEAKSRVQDKSSGSNLIFGVSIDYQTVYDASQGMIREVEARTVQNDLRLQKIRASMEATTGVKGNLKPNAHIAKPSVSETPVVKQEVKPDMVSIVKPELSSLITAPIKKEQTLPKVEYETFTSTLVDDEGNILPEEEQQRRQAILDARKKGISTATVVVEQECETKVEEEEEEEKPVEPEMRYFKPFVDERGFVSSFEFIDQNGVRMYEDDIKELPHAIIVPLEMDISKVTNEPEEVVETEVSEQVNDEAPNPELTNDKPVWYMDYIKKPENVRRSELKELRPWFRYQSPEDDKAWNKHIASFEKSVNIRNQEKWKWYEEHRTDKHVVVIPSTGERFDMLETQERAAWEERKPHVGEEVDRDEYLALHPVVEETEQQPEPKPIEIMTVPPVVADDEERPFVCKNGYRCTSELAMMTIDYMNEQERLQDEFWRSQGLDFMNDPDWVDKLLEWDKTAYTGCFPLSDYGTVAGLRAMGKI